MRKQFVLFFMSVCFSAPVWAHRVGNGGDHIRATFLQVGESVLDFLKETEQGKSVVKRAGLNLSRLEATLDVNSISVVDSALRDNTGSIVEAIGEPGKIQLNKEAWFEHFERSHDVAYLVFHEMLRSASVNDDNYVISQALNPFPISRRIETRVVPALPLIAEDLLSSVFELSKLQVNGSGCPVQDNRTRVEFNEEKNILEVELKNYRNDVWKDRTLDRKQCALALPVTLPKGKRLVISQMDLAGKVDLLAGTSTQLSFEAFLAGQSNTLKTRLVQPTQKTTGRILTRRTEVLKSTCGGSDILRLNTSLVTQSKGLALESAQVDQMTFYLSLEDCLPANRN